MLLVFSLSAVYAQNVPGKGDMFIDFTVQQDPNNPDSKVSLSDYVGKGKIVIVDFWASWCGPCRREIPFIKECYEKLPKDKVTVLSVAVADKIEETKRVAKELGVEWEQIVNAQNIPLKPYGINGIPHIIVFAPDGTIISRGLRERNVFLFASEAINTYFPSK